MYKGKRVLAIITAREGSKRVPNKNILNLAGKPLIAWTIEASLNSEFIDKTMVSTDSLKIKKIAEEYGANVPFIRPIELANDIAKSIDVIYHALDFCKKNNEEFEYAILLQPTSPLRTKNDIDNAFEMLSDETKAVVSVCETEHSPIWMNTLPENLSMSQFIKEEYKNLRSQDLPLYYQLNGAIYIAEIEYLYQNNGFLGENTKAFIMEPEASIDIDANIDFYIAESIIKNRC